VQESDSKASTGTMKWTNEQWLTDAIWDFVKKKKS